MCKWIYRVSALVVLCAVLLTGVAFAENLGGGTVNASALNLRAEPSTDAEKLTTVPRGTAVIVAEQVSSEWYRVICKGIEGYMAAQYIDFTETLDASFGTGAIQGTTVRMRATAAFADNVLGYYNTGTLMNITGVSGGWYKVEHNGTTGYVSSDYMTLASASASVQNTSTPQQGSSTGEYSAGGQTIVDTAMKYLGVPYVWAGSSPSGFDCSGFVNYVYKECGYSINRTAATIAENGCEVARTDLQVGDAVCFYNSGMSYIGHVGIYIGNNQIIHASSGGGRVMVSELTGYYDRTYHSAHRLVG